MPREMDERFHRASARMLIYGPSKMQQPAQRTGEVSSAAIPRQENSDILEEDLVVTATSAVPPDPGEVVTEEESWGCLGPLFIFVFGAIFGAGCVLHVVYFHKWWAEYWKETILFAAGLIAGVVGSSYVVMRIVRKRRASRPARRAKHEASKRKRRQKAEERKTKREEASAKRADEKKLKAEEKKRKQEEEAARREAERRTIEDRDREIHELRERDAAREDELAALRAQLGESRATVGSETGPSPYAPPAPTAEPTPRPVTSIFGAGSSPAAEARNAKSGFRDLDSEVVVAEVVDEDDIDDDIPDFMR